MGTANYPIPRKHMSDVEQAVWRLFSKTDVGEWDECWEFQGARVGDGYAHIRSVTLYGENRQYPYGHRTVWAIFNGGWPAEGEIVQHTCGSNACLNPLHLVAGPKSGVIEARIRSGKWFGAYSGKLTPTQVLEIRASLEAQTVLAKRYGVSQPTISKVRRGETYNELGEPRVPERGGARPARRKLSDESVRAIRASGEPARVLADRFGVDPTLIYRVLNGAHYADVL